MTREEVKKLLGEATTEEQVTAFLNTYQGEVNKQKDLQAQIDQMKAENDTLKGYKEEIDKINQEKMTEEQKLEAMKKEAEKNLKDSRIIANTAKAKEVLAGLDIGNDLISTLVTDDETKTLENANRLKEKMTSFEEAITKKVKETYLNANLTPPLSNKTTSNDSMTWEKFDKLSQEEQNKFATEHPDEFNNL